MNTIDNSNSNSLEEAEIITQINYFSPLVPM